MRTVNSPGGLAGTRVASGQASSATRTSSGLLWTGCTVGVSPAQDASLRAEPNRLTSAISARMTSAVNGPIPGSWVRTLTRGSDRARWRIYWAEQERGSGLTPGPHRVTGSQATSDDCGRLLGWRLVIGAGCGLRAPVPPGSSAYLGPPWRLGSGACAGQRRDLNGRLEGFADWAGLVKLGRGELVA
jgi:hypothetical protein